MEARLIKIDRNGSKHYEQLVECDRCQGRGWYAVGVHNGQLVPSHVDNAVCYKCHGAGKVISKWIERTPEYQAILDAKRAEREAKKQAEREAEEAKIKAENEERERIEAERRAKEEAEILAQLAISQYQSEVGKRITVKMVKHRTVSFESHFGWKTVYMNIHIMKDANGNVYTWKTQNSLGYEGEDERGHYTYRGIESDEAFTIVGTVKEHKEYGGEKQTVLTRCKIK